MASTKYLSIVFTGEDKGATKTFKQVDDAAETTGSKLANLGSKISPAVAAASAAVVAGVGFAMKAAFDAATESEKVSRETERVISTMGASAWTSADQIGDLSQSISNLTGKDDELIQSSANLLLTFGKVRNEVGEGNDIFDRAVGLSLDLSTALGTDASSASIQLGKALNDPVKGITALSRAGVSFTAEQKEQIKTLVETGDVLSAQKIILDELGKQFGGAAEAAKTPIETLQTKLENLTEDVGTVLMPVIGGIADAVGAVVEGFMTLPDPVKNAVLIVGGVGTAALGAIPLVAKIADTFGDVVGPAMKIFRGVVDNVALGLGTMAEKLTGNADLGQKLASGLSSAVAPALMAVSAAAIIGFGIWTMYQNGQREAEQRAKEFTETLNENTGAITGNTTAAIQKKLADDNQLDNLNRAGISVARYTAALSDNSHALGLQESELRALAITGKTDTDYKRNLIKELRNEGGARNDLIATLAENNALDSGLLSTILEQTSAYDANQEALKEKNIQAAVSKGVSEEEARATAEATAANLEQIESLKLLAEELRAQTDPYYKAIKSQQDAAEAQRKMNDAVARYGPQSKEAKDATLAAAQATVGYKGDLIALKQNMLEGNGIPEYVAAMEGLRDYGFDPSSDAARGLAYDVLTIGTTADAVDGKTVRLTAELEMKQVAARIAYLKSQADPRTGFIGLDAIYAASNMYAKGGMVDDGLFVVGEQGPELGYKIGSSVRIFSNPDSKRMVAEGGGRMSGGPVNVYVNNSGASPYEIGREVLWATKVAG